jgi:ATP-dependent DNA ligase
LLLSILGTGRSIFAFTSLMARLGADNSDAVRGVTKKYVPGDAPTSITATVLQHACRIGLGGIVAKRRDRPYRSGRCPD